MGGKDMLEDAVSAKRGLWRFAVLALVIVGSLAWMMTLEPIVQDPSYHGFADRRSALGVPNFLDVATNLPFLLVGAWGLLCSRRLREASLRRAWSAFAIGVALVAFGSGYYHWAPDDQSLVWDRLPMTIGFMGLLAAMLDEHLPAVSGSFLLTPSLLIGASSVWVWASFDDLRFYYWVQLVPLLVILTLLTSFKPRFSHRSLLFVGLAFYVLAKVAEARDAEVLAGTGGALSGHSLKHLLAAAGCGSIVFMLAIRRSLADEAAPGAGVLAGPEP